jgi:enamine deaminase RidA (YjgF/YER057c/UK114 family)
MIVRIESTNAGGESDKMKRENLSSNTTWEDILGYSRAVRVGNHVYVAGTTATNEQGEVTSVGDPYNQTVTVLERIRVALEQIGSCLADVVRVRIYVTNISSWREVSRAHKEYFDDIRPATTLVEASSLVLSEMEVEVEVEAVIREESDA